MTAAWLVQSPNGDPEAYDTERAAESRARELVASKTVTVAVVYRVDVEPDVRGPGYWTRTRKAAACQPCYDYGVRGTALNHPPCVGDPRTKESA